MRIGVALLLVPLLLLAAVPVAAAEEAPATVSSLSAVLYEPTTGRVLFEKDADTKRPMASTTKLMTALVAAEALEPDALVTVPEAAVLVEGSAVGLRGGDVLSVRDLLAGLLLSSGNDAANTLALLTSGSLPAFAARMNGKAAELNMSRSVFVTPSGLDEGEHGSTARELALLGAAVLKQPLLSELCATKVATVHINGTAVSLKNHNRLLWLYEDAVGLKTGFTTKSGKCLVSAATRDGVTLVAATLNGGDYWNDHIALYDYGFSQLEAVTLPLSNLPPVTVCGGVAGVAELTAEAPRVVLPKGEVQRVKVTYELPPFVWAPLQAGDAVGTLRYTVDDRTIATVTLTAKAAVPARAAWTFNEKWKRQLGLLMHAILE
ncbi:MAG: D-alanyl-D-alanine carboxypeptidase [Clostridia bacterium]|nr:D-alanyl-D-alanine carboxypeptidase [Clostridia bacterium]